ncbi:GNAT family N-acetyltransferase [Cohnella luojiensis]|uniref:GNAT family N-acetyltransferase n=1 Tax=Cohnella luojiensis TaxID=652876 RepID=UPI001F10898D|nr:GNAT family N-acetyltransferase [Cohnella luojiensis]
MGWCGVGVLDFSVTDKELYYLIGRDYWGNGYATEASSALTAYAFDVIGLDRLYAKADPRNKASLKIFEKLGFEFDRILAGLTSDNEECNGELMHVLTKERFIERKMDLIVTGSSGSGKTYVINELRKICQISISLIDSLRELGVTDEQQIHERSHCRYLQNAAFSL